MPVRASADPTIVSALLPEDERTDQRSATRSGPFRPEDACDRTSTDLEEAGVSNSRKRVAAAILTVVASVAGPAVAVVPAGAAPPQAQQLYVAPWGDDAGPGTLDRPFATPQRAQ